MPQIGPTYFGNGVGACRRMGSQTRQKIIGAPLCSVGWRRGQGCQLSHSPFSNVVNTYLIHSPLLSFPYEIKLSRFSIYMNQTFCTFNLKSLVIVKERNYYHKGKPVIKLGIQVRIVFFLDFHIRFCLSFMHDL